MADDSEVDLNTFPSGIDVRSELTADQSGDGSLDTGVTMIPFPLHPVCRSPLGDDHGSRSQPRTGGDDC